MSEARTEPRWEAAVVTLAVVATVAALCFFKAQDPDLGFHFATGRAVLALGKVPGTNVLSFGQPEHAWPLHQWAPGVLFELVRRRFGVEGVTLTKMTVVVATWLVTLAAVRAAGVRDRVVAALLVVLGATAASFRFVERPLLFSNLAMAIELLVVARTLTATDAAARSRAAWVGAATIAVSAQLHAGAVSAWLFLLVASCGIALEPWRARLLGDVSPGPAGARLAAPLALAAIAGLAVGAGLLALYNPHGPRVLLVPLQMAGDTYQAEHLVEFRPPTAFPTAILSSYWLLVAIASAAVALRLRTLHLSWLGLFAMGLFLSLRHVRLVYDFALVAVVVMAAAIGPWSFSAKHTVPLLLAACLGGPLHNWSRTERGLGWYAPTYPRPLFELMRAEGIRGRAFVSDGWAGPYLAEFYPAERAFFDMRLEAYSPEFARGVYQHTRYGLPGYRETLDSYAIEVVLLKYTSPGERRFQEGAPNLRQRLAVHPAFNLVAFDDQGELFVRTAGVNALAAARLSIPGVEPDRSAFTAPPRLAWPALSAALGRLPRSDKLLLLAAVAAADAGETPRAKSLLDEVAVRSPGHPELPSARAFLSEKAAHP